MRKHFLILMLLALLPLVSWAAEPLTSAKLSVRNITYGTEALAPGEQTNEGDFRSSWDRDLVLGTDFTWDGKIYSDEACTTVVTNLATAPVGNYYVKFVGKEFFEGPVTCKFQILKAPLYVTILADEISGDSPEDYTGGKLFATYGEAFDVTGLEIKNVKGLVNEEEFDDVVSGSLTGVTVEETDANAKLASTEADVQLIEGKAAYTATLLGFTSANYELVCVDEFYIKQKDISDGDGLTFALDPNFTTYNGKVQDAQYTITYAGMTLAQAERDKDGNISKANDFSVSYKVATLDDDNKITGVTGDAVNPINANVYATQIVAAENGNYAGTYPADDAAEYTKDPFVWTIKQAGLTIIALDQEKVYDGTATLPHNYDGTFEDGADEEVVAKQEAENALAVNILFPYGINEDEATAIKVGVTISAPETAIDVKEGGYAITPALSATVSSNYDINLVPGVFTITKRNVTITASDASKLYTASSDPAFAIVNPDGFEFELSAEEREAEDGGDALLAKLFEDVPATANGGFFKSATATATPGAGLHVEKKSGTYDAIGVYEGALEVKYTDKGKIKNYNVTLVAGNYTISGGKVYITALKQEKNYGAADPDWTPVKGVNYRVDGLITADKDKPITGLTLTREEGEEIGSYRITASGATVPAGYTDIVYADGEFVIKPRPITITVLTQTMKDGDKVNKLNKTAYTIDNTDANEGLVPGDVASEIFTLSLDEDDHEGSPATYNFTSWSAATGGDQYGTGTVAFVNYDEEEGLTEIVVTTNSVDGFVGNHYFIEANPADGIPNARKQLFSENAKGKLIAEDIWVKITKGADAVEASDAAPVEDGKVVLDEDENAEKFERCIQVVAVNATKFGHYEFTVNRGSLYVIDKDALVLDDKDENLAENINAKDGEKRVFVAFGSRVLKAGQWNTLVLPFKTSVSELSEKLGYVVVDRLNEANTSTSTIAIELAFGDIAANTPILVQPEEDVNLADGIFFQKNIIYSAEPKAADGAGHEFIGTYEGHNVMTGDDSEFYYSNGQKQFVHSGNTTKGYVTVGKMRAYLKDTNAGTSSAARMITIEEPNGETNVTAISEVNVDAKASVKAEGWYTINGVKLNAAPTQKGLYINNGKKVIIK